MSSKNGFSSFTDNNYCKRDFYYGSTEP